MTVNWGILSTAKIGVNHVIPAIAKSKLGNLTAIASRNQESAAEIANQFGIGKAYGSYEEMLADPDVTAVYNPLPNNLHVDWTVKAVEAGKHVLCEKPIGLNTVDAKRLKDLPSDKLVMEAFMIRFHPQWKRAQEILRSGELGTVKTIHVYFGYHNKDPENIRNIPDMGGGGLLDIGCYAIVTGRFLFGTEPKRVVSIIDRDPEFGTDRHTSGLLDFSDGMRLNFTVSTQSVPYQRVEVIGSNARLELKVPFNPPAGQKLTICQDNGSDLMGSSACIEEIGESDQYANQIDEFSKAIIEGRQPPFGLDDAISNMKVLDALLKSAETGCWENP